MKKTTNLLRRISFKSNKQDEASKQEPTGADPLHSDHEQAAPRRDEEQNGATEPTPTSGKVKRRLSRRATIRTTCSVCLNEFQHPKVLPCEHIFCAKCLKAYVNPKCLLSCPDCHQEFPVREGDPNHLPDHGGTMVALKAKKSVRKASSSNTCVGCHMSGQENKFCLHCQKVFCQLCLVGHAGVLKGQLDGMREHLMEAKTKIENKTFIKDKFREIRAKLDQVEQDQVRSIEASKAATLVELEKRKLEEEKLRDELEHDLDKVLEESAEGLDALDNEDVIVHFTEIHLEYLKSMQTLEKLTMEGLEVTDKFQIKEVKKSRQKKTSTAVINTPNGNLPELETGVDVEPEINFSSYKRHKIGDLHLTHRPTCAAECPTDGAIYVCLPEKKSIQIFSPDDGKLESAIESEFLFPIKIDFSPKFREAYILDKWKNTLSVLSSDDGSIATLVKSGHGLGHLQSACGLAIDVDTGNLIVADTGNDRVQVFTRKGHFVRLIGGRCQKDKNGRMFVIDSELSQPEDVAVSANGKSVVVADTGNNRVRVYSISGDPLLVLGMKGTGNGMFNIPTSVAIHKNKFVVVSESGNQRVQVLNIETGKYVHTFTHLKSITSIKENRQGNLVLADSKNNAIYILK